MLPSVYRVLSRRRGMVVMLVACAALAVVGVVAAGAGMAAVSAAALALVGLAGVVLALVGMRATRMNYARAVAPKPVPAAPRPEPRAQPSTTSEAEPSGRRTVSSWSVPFSAADARFDVIPESTAAELAMLRSEIMYLREAVARVAGAPQASPSRLAARTAGAPSTSEESGQPSTIQ